MKYPDFDKAFAPTPDIVRLSMEAAFRKGEKAMKIKHKITAVLSAAAVLLVVCAAAVFALPNESQPDVVSQPVLAEPAEDPTVYYTQKGVYYHSIEDCSGMKNAQPHPLTEAQTDGKLACPVCIQSTASTDATAAPYGASTVLSESGQVALLESRPLPTEQAHDANPTPTPTPVEEDFFHGSEAAEEQIVYYNDNGQYYHFYMHCSGMRGAKYHTLTEAKQAGKPACPACVPDEVDGNLVYYSNDPSHADPVETFYPVDAVPAEAEITPAKLGSDIFLNVFGAYLFDIFEDFEYIDCEAWGGTGTDGVISEEFQFHFSEDGAEFTPVVVTVESRDEKILSGSIFLNFVNFSGKAFREQCSPWYQNVCAGASDTMEGMGILAAGSGGMAEVPHQITAFFDSELKPSVCVLDYESSSGYITLSYDINGDEASLASMNYNISRA